MSNFVSLELCKELYELSGWKDTNDYYDVNRPLANPGSPYGILLNLPDNLLPAYDLGFLMRKLPPHFHTGDARGAFEFFLKTTGREWFAGYNKPEMGKWLYDSNHGVWEHPCNADTPENAVCALVIELIKQGILPTKENK